MRHTHYDDKIAKTEAEVQAAIQKQQELHESVPKDKYVNKQIACAELTDTFGHPLNTYTRENAVLAELIENNRAKLADAEALVAAGAEGPATPATAVSAEVIANLNSDLKEMRQIAIHYASKGDLLYPVLDANYGITGPSAALWTEDDDIRDEMSKLVKLADSCAEGNGMDAELSAEWVGRYKAIVNRAEQMITKEENILFPICAVNFTPEEWKGIYRDSMDYSICFGVKRDVWEEAEAEKAAGTGVYAETYETANVDGEVVLPGGHMTLTQLRALLNTIPAEITFIDDLNINRFFNEGPKDFKRPGMAIDREVWTCHPPKVEPMVRAIIDDFRNGRRDEVPVWMEKNGKTLCVRYIAVRDMEGNYVGTLEYVQDMSFAKAHFLGAK